MIFGNQKVTLDRDSVCMGDDGDGRRKVVRFSRSIALCQALDEIIRSGYLAQVAGTAYWIPRGIGNLAVIMQTWDEESQAIAYDIDYRADKMRPLADFLDHGKLFFVYAGNEATLRELLGNEHEENVETENGESPSEEAMNSPGVGILMGFFCPGSAHFFAGKRAEGIFWFLSIFVAQLLLISTLIVPGNLCLVLFIGVLLALLSLFGSIVVSSHRPTRRLGLGAWFLFVLFIASYNTLILPLLMNTTVKPFCMETYSMNGMSMAPTLQASSEVVPDSPKISDRIVVNKMVYRFYEPKRGDIIVYRMISESGMPVPYCKRIVGLPGETVDIESPYILIGGKQVNEPPIFKTMAENRNGYSGYVSLQDIGMFDANRDVQLPITLEPGEYFVLGDNSKWSRDSRFTGPIRRSDILGKAIRICWPPNRFGDLK